LKQDTIDLWQLHRFDEKVPAEETLGAIKKMRDAGKIRHVGLSEVSVEQIKMAPGIRAHRQRPEFVQSCPTVNPRTC
jgi:aryl-alcohol dehydrogenase-like predicted oxidoreductase